MTLPYTDVNFRPTAAILWRPVLSRNKKNQQPAGSNLTHPTRRDFLIRSCQTASAALIPARFYGFGWPKLLPADEASSSAISPEYHLHPHYKTPRPLDTLLLKTNAALDDFITEKYADEIAAILTGWSNSLIQTPTDLSPIQNVLHSNFTGFSWQTAESRVIRQSTPIETRQNKYKSEPSLRCDTYLSELRAVLTNFVKIQTAEFQIASIAIIPTQSTSPTTQLQTTIRYELDGSGRDSYREQRIGYWQLTWERSLSGEFSLMRWQSLQEEQQATSTSPIYIDITAATVSSNSSYAAQILHGTDYWRTVLDGACGIDIYGHNGISVGDIDGDGFDDLYICQPGGLPNRLYRNRGDGTFEDITESSGVGVLDNTACALFVDVDNDGRQDLIVVRATGPMLFLNQGDGKFLQKADAFQFATPPQGTFTGAAVADYDRDGWLDIYFCLYVYYQGTDQYKYPSPYFDAKNGPPNFLMRNNRDNTFRDVTNETGLNQNNTRYSFCCGWNDFNNDGWPDLYVVNDFGRKNLYRNNGDGTFTDIAAEVGVEDVGAGMGVCWFDYDNDGVEDLYVADMWTVAGERISMQDQFKKDSSQKIRDLYRKHAMGNSLFRNTSRREVHSRFEDTTMRAGVGIGRWAWSCDAFDFDHDGFADLYIVNGMISGPSRDDLNSFFWRQVVANSPDEARPSANYEQAWSAINELIRADGTWSGYERNVFYANNGDGTFSDISALSGLDFPEDGRAFALADFDHDGRQEIFLKNRNAPQLRVLKNTIEALPPSISFWLRGTKSNRDAIGAVINIETNAGRQTRSLQAGTGFLSQHSKEIFFGLGQAKGQVQAEIRWPSGQVQQFKDLPPNHRILIEEGNNQFKAEPFTKTKASERTAQTVEVLPSTTETWLLATVDAPDFVLPNQTDQTKTLSSFRGKTVFLNFWSTDSDSSKSYATLLDQLHAKWSSQNLEVISVDVDSFDDTAAIYNILYRYIFDRHRDLTLPTSFLINPKGEIVKIYQGPIHPDEIESDAKHIPQTTSERLARALPFPGVTDAIEFGRNYLSIGSIFFQRGYMDQAQSCFRIALHDDPMSAEALYGIGSVYLDQQKLAEARDSFTRALKLRASYPDTLANSWNNLGILAAREGHTAEAIGNFQEALKLSPDHMVALNNLGSAYRQEKRWNDAQQTYERALQINPNDAESNYGAGMVYAQRDDTDRAFNFLQKALQLRPIYPEALNNLGILYLRTQRANEAVVTFKKCIELAPAFDQAYLNLARVYVIEGDSNGACEILLALLKQHPNHSAAQQMLNELQNK